MKNIAIILSWGTGSRFWDKLPKQFTKLAGKTIIEYTIEVFQKNKNIDEIIIVSHKDYIFLLEEIILKNNYENIKIISGGSSRQESSYSALVSLEWELKDTDNILFHDAVRPFLSQEIINNTIKALNNYNAVDVAIEVTDTIINIDDNFIKNIPNRGNLKRWQTPQGFKYWLIRKAHELAIKQKFNQVTDDCWLVLHFFPEEKIFIVDGEEKNIKITYPLDTYIANQLIQLWEWVKETKIDFSRLKDKIHIVFWYSSWIGKEIFEILKKNWIIVYGFSLSNWFDITKEKNIKDALEKVYTKEWKIDNIIITAWILKKEKLQTSSTKDIIKQINVNYIWSTLVSKFAINYLEKTQWNLLLFGSSSYSKWRAFYSIYSSTKSALINFTQALAEELHPKNIKVNIINPERTLTKMRVENFWKEDKNTLLDPKNVAKIALNVLSKNITGQIFDVKVSDFNK